ncbi:hypothetical protein SAMN04487911_10666 [Arenibacter nanhaiticus]|uniref:Uncharacterized protein n=1 Tax=Arenibacter nanhaiticus TaxID=558155 RepID=A0A1M6E8V5_9FLAO|nr:hypothetical protein SAMN04487911_10666 [Arenibacter nanhaiticus]
MNIASVKIIIPGLSGNLKRLSTTNVGSLYIIETNSLVIPKVAIDWPTK